MHIERIVLVKLNDVYAAERQAIALHSQKQLAQIPQVLGLSVGVPADEKARSSWDLSLVIRFACLADLEAYLSHPVHRSYVDGFLAPRMDVLKAWNFEPPAP